MFMIWELIFFKPTYEKMKKSIKIHLIYLKNHKFYFDLWMNFNYNNKLIWCYFFFQITSYSFQFRQNSFCNAFP